MGKSEKYPGEGVPAGVLCEHVHHNRLLEWSTGSLEARAAHVRKEKPEDEVEVRLRLMRPVEGELPAEVVEARRVLDEARRAHDEARRARDKDRRAYAEALRVYGEAGRAHGEARRVLDEARRAHDEALRAWDEARCARDEARRAYAEALHEEECPGCPWDGSMIFPGRVDAR